MPEETLLIRIHMCYLVPTIEKPKRCISNLREIIMAKRLLLLAATAILLSASLPDTASAQRGFRGFGGVRAVGIGGYRGIGVGGLGWRGAGLGIARPGWGWGGGWRRGWGWGAPLLAAGVAGAATWGYGYGYGGSNPCLAWNGWTWVNICYAGLYGWPYDY